MRGAGRLGVLLFALLSCRNAAYDSPRVPPSGRSAQPEAPLRREVGTEIVVCGERFDIGVPVVLWFEEPHYNAYSEAPRFQAEGLQGLRYLPGRRPRNQALADAVERQGWNLANLQAQVDQFVLHYDVCGSSRRCFKVLQDLRQLSVHFLLDADGTLYQTLDLKEQAWHARQANPRSIGVEITHIGAYPVGQPSPLEAWYPLLGGRRRLRLPAAYGDGGLRTRGFVGFPARQELQQGRIQGGMLKQFDYTKEQYESLAHLSAALAEIFPKLRLDAPRDASGQVRNAVLGDAEWEAFGGILGHYHVSSSKIDPGPALDWEALLSRARSIALQP